LIHSGDNKHDRLDAEQLARVARMDPRLLSPIEHRARQSRADLVLLRARDLLVRSRTQMVCHVRGALKSLGTRLPKCSTRTLPSRGLPGIPEDLRPALLPVLQMVRLLTRVILLYDKRIEEVASARYPETTTRRQVNGVGSLTSLAFVLTIEDPTRFRSSRRVGAHLGLRRE
jgi:transposase